MLAKARSDFIARRAALSAPTAILPRLLMCSGLPRTSLLTMIDRVGKLGDQGEDKGKVFSQLFVPSATSEWGVGYLGSRRDFARKLLGRLSAYLSTKPDGDEVDYSKSFLHWLSDECRGLEKSRKPRLKKNLRADPSNSGYLVNMTSLSSVLSDLTDSIHPTVEPSAHVDDSSVLTKSMILMHEPKSVEEEVPVAGCDGAVVKSFIELCFQTERVVPIEKWLHKVCQDKVSSQPCVSGQIKKSTVSQNEFVNVAVMLLEAQSSLCQGCDGLTRIVVKWVPLLTQTGGSEPLWEIMFRANFDSLQDVWRLLLSRCASVWRQEHIHACRNWILSNASIKSTLCPSRMVKFLVLTSGLHSVHVQAFSSAFEKLEPFTSETEREVTAGACLALKCLKQNERTVNNKADVVSRNDLPEWLILLLLLARRGKKHMKGVTDAILTHVPQEKGYARLLVCSSVLRLYSYYPRAMNLGNPVLRSLLVEAASALAFEWREWRSPLDEQLEDMLSSLRANPHQRLVQALRDLSKDHPLLVLRKLPEFVSVLEQDGGVSSNRTQSIHASDRRGRVHGEELRLPLQAKINGRNVTVSIRHWGFSFSEPLWTSVVDIFLIVPREVLFSCGLAMGLRDLFCVYIRLLFLQSQLQKEDKESRLRGRVLEMFSVFRSSNTAAWDEWCNSPMPGLESQGTTSDILSHCGMYALTKTGDELSRRSQ